MANKKISELNTVTLPLSGDEEIAIVQGGETKKIAISEVGGGGVTLTPLITNATVTGTYDLAYGNNYDLTLTGNTTFTESNFPSIGLTDIIAIRVTGNFALTYPANWTTSIIGVYNGTKQNDIFVYRIASGKYSVVINTY